MGPVSKIHVLIGMNSKAETSNKLLHIQVFLLQGLHVLVSSWVSRIPWKHFTYV